MKQYLIDLENRSLTFLGEVNANSTSDMETAIGSYNDEHGLESHQTVWFQHPEIEALHRSVVADEQPAHTFYAISDHATIDRLEPEAGRLSSLEEAQDFAKDHGDYTSHHDDGVFNSTEILAWFDEIDLNL